MPGRHPLCRLPGAGLVANLELRKAINQQIREIWFALWSTLPDKQFHASPFRFVCTPEKAGQYANAWDVISMSWPVGFHDGLMYVVLLSFLSAFVFACQSWSFYMSSKLLTGYEEALRPLGFFWVVMWRTGFYGRLWRYFHHLGSIVLLCCKGTALKYVSPWAESQSLRLGEEILRLEPGNRLVLEYQAENLSCEAV